MNREDTLPRVGIKLLAAGVVSSALAGIVLMGIVWAAADGSRGLAAGIGAGMGLLAMGLSQAVLTATWRMSGARSMAMGMVAYTVGVAGVICGMIMIRSWTDLDLFWTGIGVIAAALAYITAAALTYPRLRILLYSNEGQDDNELVHCARAETDVETRGTEQAPQDPPGPDGEVCR